MAVNTLDIGNMKIGALFLRWVPFTLSFSFCAAELVNIKYGVMCKKNKWDVFESHCCCIVSCTPNCSVLGKKFTLMVGFLLYHSIDEFSYDSNAECSPFVLIGYSKRGLIIQQISTVLWVRMNSYNNEEHYIAPVADDNVKNTPVSDLPKWKLCVFDRTFSAF